MREEVVTVKGTAVTDTTTAVAAIHTAATICHPCGHHVARARTDNGNSDGLCTGMYKNCGR